MSVATTNQMPSKPKEIAQAEAWFQRNYSQTTLSAVCGIQNGKASGLIYIPPVTPAVLELILNLAKGMVDRESQP